TIIWKRDLPEGFMIHRNTLLATDDALYIADHQSLKRLDGDTGKITQEIVAPKDGTDGVVWKWMGLARDGILIALVGGSEIEIATKRSNTPGLGHWPWGMWKGHRYGDPKKNFGFGRNFIAVELKTGKVLWNHREAEYIDSRGVCMKDGRLYFYAPGKHLGCLDTNGAKLLWRNESDTLLKAIGAEGRAQHYVTGYATTTYMKCTDYELLFAGPQRARLVSASTRDGSLLWSREGGNLQLVLRKEGIFAAGPGSSGIRLAYGTGEELARLPTRRACTRATGSVDSIFYRTRGGTVRLDVENNAAQHIAPMRPPCQDGVLISEGHLYWGPWMCGCQLSLYGHIALGPKGDFDLEGPAPERRLQSYSNTTSPPTGAATPLDWTAFRGDFRGSNNTRASVPARVKKLWSIGTSSATKPTAPISVGGVLYFGDYAGAVHAVDKNGRKKWTSHTGASIFYPPSYETGRLFVGSADGWVYCLDAATGARVWRYRVAPEERRIPVYGNLISTWPVAGGVLVQDGVVYAAAGITHYDGTHVVALDAASGKVKWYNGDSGKLSKKADSGVSLQGELSIRGKELVFAGGGRQRTARYSLETGACLNTPYDGLTSRFQTAFYPYFPSYAQFSSCRRDYSDGRTLLYEASYEGSRHGPLQLLEKDQAPKKGQPTDRRRDAKAEKRRRGIAWSIRGERYNSLIAAENSVLAVGQRGDRSFIASIDLKEGTRRWEIPLETAAVKDGAAVSRSGRVIVSLTDGRVECYGEE
ncbi:MAG: PQQ-binding-like beta-propeller repeat protein, partial [Planctomycetota bacterium]